jgi:hypothetical protein
MPEEGYCRLVGDRVTECKFLSGCSHLHLNGYITKGY